MNQQTNVKSSSPIRSTDTKMDHDQTANQNNQLKQKDAQSTDKSYGSDGAGVSVQTITKDQLLVKINSNDL